MSDSIRSAVLAGLVTALESTKDDTTYPIQFTSIEEVEQSLANQRNESVLLVSIDTGAQEIQCADGSAYRFSLPIELRGSIVTSSSQGVITDKSNLIAAIQKFIDGTTPSTIHSACKALYFEDAAVLALSSIEERMAGRAMVLITMRLIYVATAGSF